MSSTLKFPYTMYCPGCKVGIKIKNPKMVGQTIHCPKCKKRIPVVTPDEDGYIPYKIAGPPPEDPDLGPSEEELIRIEEEKQKELREKRIAMAKYIGSILIILAQLGGISWVIYKKVWVEGYAKKQTEKKDYYKAPR